MSNTHLDELLAKRESDGCKELEDEIAEVKKVSTELKVDDKIPCYFNSGCCSLANAAITGLEIIEEKIQLIKCKAGESKTVKREESLSKLFELLR